MIFLLYYHGKKHWNYTSFQVVRAPDEEAARRLFCSHNEPEEWSCTPVPQEGDDDIIASGWVGDPG